MVDPRLDDRLQRVEVLAPQCRRGELRVVRQIRTSHRPPGRTGTIVPTRLIAEMKSSLAGADEERAVGGAEDGRFPVELEVVEIDVGAR